MATPIVHKYKEASAARQQAAVVDPEGPPPCPDVFVSLFTGEG